MTWLCKQAGEEHTKPVDTNAETDGGSHTFLIESRTKIPCVQGIPWKTLPRSPCLTLRFNMRRSRKNKIKMQNSLLFNIFDGCPGCCRCRLVNVNWPADMEMMKNRPWAQSPKPDPEPEPESKPKPGRKPCQIHRIFHLPANPLTILLLAALRWLVAFLRALAKIFATQNSWKSIARLCFSNWAHTQQSAN